MVDELANNKEQMNSHETRKEERRISPPGRQNFSRRQNTNRYVRNVNFRSRRKVCAFCVDKVKVIDWKNPDSFRRFIGDDGSIRARRKTGTCAKHQRRLAVAIKQARHLALLPFTGEHIRLSNKS